MTAGLGEPYTPMLTGARVLCVRWLPGTDELVAVCYCGGRQQASDPIQAWEWLLGHPVGHEFAGALPVAASPTVEHVSA